MKQLILIYCTAFFLSSCSNKISKHGITIISDNNFYKKNEKIPVLIDSILSPFNLECNPEINIFSPIELTILGGEKKINYNFSDFLFKYMKGTAGNPDNINLYNRKFRKFFTEEKCPNELIVKVDSNFSYNFYLKEYIKKAKKDELIYLISENDIEDSLLFEGKVIYGMNNVTDLKKQIQLDICEYPNNEIVIITNPPIMSNPFIPFKVDSTTKIDTVNSATFNMNIIGNTTYNVGGKSIVISKDTTIVDGKYTFNIHIINNKQIKQSEIIPKVKVVERIVYVKEKTSPTKRKIRQNSIKNKKISQPPTNKLVDQGEVNSSIEKK